MSIGESDRHRRPILRKEGRLGAYSLDGGRRSGGGRGGREEGGVEAEVVDNGERLQRVVRPGRGRLEVDKPGGHKEAPPFCSPSIKLARLSAQRPGPPISALLLATRSWSSSLRLAVHCSLMLRLSRAFVEDALEMSETGS